MSSSTIAKGTKMTFDVNKLAGPAFNINRIAGIAQVTDSGYENGVYFAVINGERYESVDLAEIKGRIEQAVCN